MTVTFGGYTFINPEFFLLLLLLPVIGGWYYWRYRQHYATLRMSSLQSVAHLTSWRGRFRSLLPIFRALSFIFLVIALARPQKTLKEEEVKAEGIDIVLVLD
jgi:Ca-activated chloride channel family protein